MILMQKRKTLLQSMDKYMRRILDSFPLITESRKQLTGPRESLFLKEQQAHASTNHQADTIRTTSMPWTRAATVCHQHRLATIALVGTMTWEGVK